MSLRTTFEVSPKAETTRKWLRICGGGGVGCGGTAAGEEGRVRESGSGDRVDPLMGSLFGLAGKIPPEKFSGGGATVAGGGEGSPEKKVERERCMCISCGGGGVGCGGTAAGEEGRVRESGSGDRWCYDDDEEGGGGSGVVEVARGRE
ncbi:hypothetical protein Tco_0533459 [Tanacetum coccineum]